MPAASLSAKVAVDLSDYSRPLATASRQWEKFGRDLNQGAAAMGKTFGGAAGSLGVLSRGFEVAGRAAGIFAGLDGIAGIASSLAVGGPVLAALTAATLAVGLLGETARKESESLKKFSEGLDALINAGNVAAMKKQAQDIWKGTPAKGFLDGLETLEKQESEILARMNATAGITHAAIAKQLSEFRETSDIDVKRKQFEGLRKAIFDVSNTPLEFRGLDAMTIQATRLTVAFESAAEAVKKLSIATAGAGVASAIANAPRMPGVGAVGATPSGATSVNMTGWVVPQPLVDLTHKTDEVKGAIVSGFLELPNALGSVLGGLLVPLFGSNNRGAGIGAGLGGAFGAGAGSFLAGRAGAGIGSAIGGAFLPVIGSVVGGLIGGALGGLFGSGKKHMDDLAYEAGSAAVALHRLTTEILNGAPGFRAAATRFAASTPMAMGGGGYWTEEGRGGSAGGSGTPIVIQVDGRSLARVVVNTLRREAQAQWGDSLRIAEVAL